MKLTFEKTNVSGVVFDATNTIRGLWFVDAPSTTNVSRLTMAIAFEEVTNGRRVDDSDYAAVMAGVCEVKPGPISMGGYFVIFPSQRCGVV